MSDFSSFFEPDPKRRKVIDSLELTDQELGTEKEEKLEPMNYDELMELQHKRCFACDYIHAKALEQNEDYAYMMMLYTQNSANICKDAIYKNIHRHFKTFIVPGIKEAMDDLKKEHEGDPDTLKRELEQLPEYLEWPVETIKEHFEMHTNYPTDEILFQIRLKRAVRRKLSDNLMEKREDGTIKFNHKNLDAMMKMEKSIVELFKTKKDINTMVGFEPTLDY